MASPSDQPVYPADADGSRGRFASSLGTILATAGVAIGLGNIWRFPYMMGRDGGAAFLGLYLVFMVALGAPMLMCEWSLGRHTRRGPWGAYQRVGMRGGGLVAGLIVVTIVMAASYYGVVVAWVLQTALSQAGGALGMTGEAPTTFKAITGSPARQMAFLALTVSLGCGALALGVRRGIERISSIVLPLFFALLCAVLYRVLTMEGAQAGLRSLLAPEVSALSWRAALSAMGQAIFSLGLGGMFMVLYGGYMRDEASIPAGALGTVGADLAAALLAGAIVVPAVLATGTDLASGPTLLFEVLPGVFAGSTLGAATGAAFFLGVFFVAMLSLIAAYEAIVAALGDGLGMRRGRALLLVLGAQIALATPAYFIARYIEVSDFVWGTTMQPVGAGLAVIAAAWCLGRARTMEQIRRSSRLPVPGWLFLWIKWVIPGAMAVILVMGWMEWLRR